jgi:hypothetical protein
VQARLKFAWSEPINLVRGNGELVTVAVVEGEFMSISAVSSGSIYQELQAYFQQRGSDVSQLGQDLSSGNLANAQQDFTALEALGQTGPFKSGNTFNNGGREQDFNAIGQALQSGDLSGAQAAFAQLEATFQKNQNSSAADFAESSTAGSSLNATA